MDKLFELFSYFVLISVASERFTEVVKRCLFNSFKPAGVVYQIISGLFGAYLAYNMPPEFLSKVNINITAIIVGFAVSGGSSAWNSVLVSLTEYSKAIKTPTKENP